MALGTVNVPPKPKHTHTSVDISDFTEKVNTLAAEQVGKTTPKSHSHAYSDITDKPSSFTPASHNQAASTITAGTFGGQVVAHSSYQTYSTYLLRNTRLASSDTNPTVNGQICWTYK